MQASPGAGRAMPLRVVVGLRMRDPRPVRERVRRTAGMVEWTFHATIDLFRTGLPGAP